MGVTGLWRLVEPAGKPVPVETLENKVLAVDISIWLHQMVKGYQDAKGAPLPNAHLMGLFQRLCKLLYFRIKPVFIFDGAFPELKKETIGKRQDIKAKYHSDSERLKRELALLLSKKTAVGRLLGKQISPKKGNASNANDDDIFKLPALPEKAVESESESEGEDSSGSIIDMHSVDVESEKFKSLPVRDKYNLLLDLKETRKMNSWGKLHELPKKSDNFSDFQMQRLLKRRKVQECLEETEKEMGDAGMSLNELESLLNEEGIDTKIETFPTRRIASDNTTRILMINNVKQALEDARKRKEAEAHTKNIQIGEQHNIEETTISKKNELEEDLEKAIKMSLEYSNEANTSVCSSTSKTDDSWTSALTDSDYTDSEDSDGYEPPDISSAKAYIMQYSDFTSNAIDVMVVGKNKGKGKAKITKADKIIQELNKEKSVIVDKVELSSSDDENYQNVNEIKSTRNIETNSAFAINLDDFKSNKEDVIACGDFRSNDEDVIATDDFKSNNEDLIQESVLFVDNSHDKVITLDTSNEGDSSQKEEMEQISQSESSDDEFEEVPEKENEIKKPVVEITVKYGDSLVNDIFADIFSNNEKNINDETVTDMKPEEENTFPKFTNVIKDLDVKEVSDSKINEVPDVLGKEPIVKQSTSGVKINLNSINVASTVDEDSESELQKAIQMSLECANEEVIPVLSADDDSESVKPNKEILTTDKLNHMAEEIQKAEQDLLQEKGRLDRIGRNITEQMTKEAQELLQIFGIPYIVAPMEAEAQCAFLESVNLTDGTITDDSDIWLFGGRTVYKNFFNQKKHVLQFLAERIERSFNLTREQLVLLALLVGSDYTTGVTGVGPVTALEILASFPFNKKELLNVKSKQDRYTQIVAGLQEFKKWVKAGKRTDNTTLKKKLKNVDLTDDFPSLRVVQAYLEPNIEKSEEKFTWGEIDITILRDYAKAKFGWSQSKLDEIVKPVIKRLVDRKCQRSVQDYFKRKVEFQSLEENMSKRVKAAVQKMGPDAPTNEEAPHDGIPKPTRKRKATKSTSVTDKQGPSKTKQKKTKEDRVLKEQGVTVVSQVQDGEAGIEINIPKTDRFQEIIPQREKDKQSLLQNKMKAIEIFRKTKMDKKKKHIKRRANVPKDKAELSESSESD